MARSLSGAFGAAVVAALLSLPACAGSGAGAAGARLSASPEAFDFGNVLPEKTLERDITLRNVGDAELVVKNVSTTCNCTVVDGSYAAKLAPGASSSMRVRITTPAYEGRTEQTVSIDTNDSERPRVEVKVSATVIATQKRSR